MEWLIFFCLPAEAYGYFAINVGHVVTVRADPIVMAGRPGGHVHHVYGGNGFGLTQSFEDARAATCNTSPFMEDNSNYWTNALYRVNPDSTYTLVETQGALIYYKFPRNAQELGVEAFPEGFRMVAGGVDREHELSEDAVFECVNYAEANPPRWTARSLDDVKSRRCEQLQVRIGMPECFDGRTDSPNHRDHVTALRQHGGRCPDSHPKRLPQLFFEFNYPWQQYADERPGSSFVFADMTKTQHADFLNGWDVSKLQQVVNQCVGDFDTPCLDRLLTSNGNSQGCKIDGQKLVREEITNVATLPMSSGDGGGGAGVVTSSTRLLQAKSGKPENAKMSVRIRERRSNEEEPPLGFLAASMLELSQGVENRTIASDSATQSSASSNPHMEF